MAGLQFSTKKLPYSKGVQMQLDAARARRYAPARRKKPVLTEKAAPVYPSGAADDSRARRALRNSQFQARNLSDLGNLQRADYTQVYRPGIRRAYDTAEMPIQTLVDRASVDTGLAYDKSRGILNRNMSRMGVNPNAGRFQGLQQQWGLARAAAEAGAMTRARRTGKEDNFRRLLDAVGMAGGAAGGARSSYGGAAGIANQAVGRYDQWATEKGRLSGLTGTGSQSLQNEINKDFDIGTSGLRGSAPVVSERSRARRPAQTQKPVYKRVPNTLKTSPYEGVPSGPGY